MKLLLDTHTFLWMDSDPNRLSETAQALITDPNNEIQLCVVSLWEIVIKASLGRLTLRVPLRQILEDNVRTNGMRVIPIAADHALDVEQLPPIHKDPFDRMLASVARCEGATLVTADRIFDSYPVDVQW